MTGGVALQVASRQASFASRQTSARHSLSSRTASRGLSMRLPSRLSLSAALPLLQKHAEQGMQIFGDLCRDPGRH